MKRKPRTYESEAIVVEYDANRCIHVKECVLGLPKVFDPERRPWIAPDRASVDEVAEVVRRCPTGALHYRTRVGEREQSVDPNRVTVASDGPLYMKGRLRIRTRDGKTFEETRAALCRCGASQNKPYCDGAHADAGFSDPATDIPSQLGTGESVDEQAPLDVTFEPDGPILVDGPVAVCGSDMSQVTGIRGALCRCGHAAAKPFCDGSHFAAGFQAD